MNRTPPSRAQHRDMVKLPEDNETHITNLERAYTALLAKPESHEDKALAWDAVVEAITNATGSEDWLKGAPSGVACAINAIERLARHPSGRAVVPGRGGFPRLAVRAGLPGGGVGVAGGRAGRAGAERPAV